jgi:copper resistance protein B
MSTLTTPIACLALVLSTVAQAQHHSHLGERADPAQQPEPDHSQHAGDAQPVEPDHSQHAGHSQPEAPSPGPVLPAITDADRQAAFPDLRGHPAHDRAINSFVLIDKLEWQDAQGGGALSWDANGWIGGDIDRLWFRAEGERVDSRTESSETHLLWGRHFSRWWDFVAGARHDFQPGPSQSWAAIGVQGVAPYHFEIEATAYLGEGGQTAARFEAEYELLLTNRLILQPLIELDIYGKNDDRRGIGSGISSAEAGLRLRYEIRREIAPYIGLTWERKLGNTADLAELDGEDLSDTRFIAGLRIWF